MDYYYRVLALGIHLTQSMQSRDVNNATRLAEASWRRDKVAYWRRHVIPIWRRK